MLNCHDVAAYFLYLAGQEDGELISNLKLQKLAYYAQGFHLALNGIPLFPEDIEAWQHGPVVPALYHAYKQHGSGPIPIVTELSLAKYSIGVQELLDEVYEVYGQFSAWKLRNMTHEERPWIDAQKLGGSISPAAMQEFFKERLA